MDRENGEQFIFKIVLVTNDNEYVNVMVAERHAHVFKLDNDMFVLISNVLIIRANKKKMKNYNLVKPLKIGSVVPIAFRALLVNF